MPGATAPRPRPRAAFTTCEYGRSEGEAHRDLPGARTQAQAPLAVQRAERLVRADLQQIERVVVGQVEEVQCRLETTAGEAKRPADPCVQDVSRRQTELA